MTTTASSASDVTIRRAERTDLLDITRIEDASFPQPWPYHAFVRFLDEPGFLVAVDEDSVVGYVIADQVAEDGGTIGHIKDFAVRPDRRGEGIGTRLLDRGLEALAERGLRRVKLEVREGNESAIRLYERFGFAYDHAVPEYYQNEEDALVLTADLSEY